MRDPHIEAYTILQYIQQMKFFHISSEFACKFRAEIQILVVWIFHIPNTHSRACPLSSLRIVRRSTFHVPVGKGQTSWKRFEVAESICLQHSPKFTFSELNALTQSHHSKVCAGRRGWLSSLARRWVYISLCHVAEELDQRGVELALIRKHKSTQP